MKPFQETLMRVASGMQSTERTKSLVPPTRPKSSTME